MTTFYTSEVNVKKLGFDELADEAMKLLRMEIGELYATLGGQLLAQNVPTRVAGIVSYLSALRSASEAKTFYQVLPSEPAPGEWGRGLGIIYEELKQDGIRLFAEVNEDLRKALCNEDILRLPEPVSRSTMQIVVMVVGAALRIPRELDPISATVSAIIVKLGLRNFCRGTGLTSENA